MSTVETSQTSVLNIRGMDLYELARLVVAGYNAENGTSYTTPDNGQGEGDVFNFRAVKDGAEVFAHGAQVYYDLELTDNE